ncbi:hypothetical protein DPMN_058954 [Dreissena polymorpha]|uniref:Telomerase reverse transcriptase n=2 Tax=Dreissena polymorpha TaxID=45954 RepID=A0A9D4C323_DREPO|nr:hypothetical protein DPMN_058954 [Dreissena polymorpha]
MGGSKTIEMERVHEKRGTQSLKRKRFDSNYEKQQRIETKKLSLQIEDGVPVKETPAFKTQDYLQGMVGTSGVDASSAVGKRQGMVGTSGVDASCAVGKRTKRKTVCAVNHTYRSTQAIDRKCILYVRNVREKFPKSSALSRLGDTSGSQLFSEVFTVLEATEGAKTRVVELLSEFGRKFKKGPTRTILTALCPLNKNATGKSVLTSKGCNISKLLQGHHHHRQVYLFVRACIRRMFPEELIGGRHNRKVLLKNISKVISLGKYDKMSLGQLMSGIKTKNVQWLLSVECNRCRLDLMSRLVHWIITQFVFVLLRTHFYITDTTFLRHRLVYYRQATWTRLHIQGMTGLLRRKIMSPVSEMFVRNLVSSRAGLGISTLRFLPKQKSLSL